MKFEEFLVLSDTLKEQNLTIKDLKEDPEMINEVFGIRKHLVSWGIKEVYAAQLRSMAKTLNKNLIDKIKSSTAKLIASKQSILNKYGEAEQIPAETQRQIGVIERKIVETINNLADKLSKIKTEQVDAKVDKSSIKDTHKAAIKYYWQTLLADIKINALTTLIKQKVVENPDLETAVNNAIKTKKEELQKTGQEINQQIEDEAKEAEKAKEDDSKETAVEDENEDGKAESIDTPWIDKFTLKGSNSAAVFKATSVHDDWRRLFEIVDVKGDFASRGIDESWTATFGDREIEVGKPVKIHFYDRQGNFATTITVNPSELTDWEIIPGDDMNYGDEYDIPQPPQDLPDDAADEVSDEETKPDKKEEIKTNILKIKHILTKELQSDKSTEEKKEAKGKAVELVKKLAGQIKKLEGYPESTSDLIDLMEEKFKGSISLFPEYTPQTILSKDDEI